MDQRIQRAKVEVSGILSSVKFSKKKTSPRQRTDKPKKFAEDKTLEYSSVQKALGILLSFVPKNKAMGNLELSKTLGLNKSTISRLTHILTYYGLLQQNIETQKYELGRTSALLGMAVAVSQHEQLAKLGLPYVNYLRDTVRESVCLEVLVPLGHVKVICGAVGPPPLSVIFPETIPTHTAAGAKVILAYSGEDDREKHGSGVVISNPEEIRQLGVAYDHGEANSEVRTVSAAIFNQWKTPIAALSICVPATRVDKIMNSINVTLLKRTAMMISDRCPDELT